ncbi:transposase, partial [Escherichia coli]
LRPSFGGKPLSMVLVIQMFMLLTGALIIILTKTNPASISKNEERDRPDIAFRYYYKGVLWSPGYFASSCGGAPISVIRQYIEQQQTPGQVENRALYPRPEGWGFTAHRIKSAI